VKDGYYSMQKSIDAQIKKRLAKEKEAKKYYKKLPFFVNMISKFPFVRGIAISGSLSKGVMYEDGDIDYFIITAKDRLWICRTFLVLFKKIFLFNSKKYFCVNYFVDENNMNIIDKNMFTAIEVTHLMPVFNQELVDQLKTKNNWTTSFLPNFKYPLKPNLNTFKKKKKNLLVDIGKFELTLRTNRGISKHHPQDFQNKVLKGLQERLTILNTKK